MSERTLTVAEAAQALGTTEKAVRRRIERGVLPSLLGPDKRRRVPASALGLDAAGMPPASPAGAQPPARAVLVPPSMPLASPEPGLLDRLERLARENGQLRMLEEVAGRDRDALLEARARVKELEAQLAAAPGRRWWQRGR